MEICPCGSSKNYAECCGLYINGSMLAPTPETLMRSRYTAYTKALVDYIQKTMRAPANIDFNLEDARTWATSVNWLGLEVLRSSQDGDQGIVEFIAHFSHGKHKQVLHEISEFQRINQEWFYTNGIGPDNKPLSREGRVPRNDTCPCGSLKKYKKCCGFST